MSDTIALDFDKLAEELSLQPSQVENVLHLLDDGNTVPFITRYRKERTGNLDEEAIRAIEERAHALRQLAERAATVLRSIESQGKLTPELRGEILSADSLKRLDDLYLPFRPKRRSRAQMARERGLEPLADLIWNAGESRVGSLDQLACPYVDPVQDLPDAEAVLKGVADILAERISEHPQVREAMRQIIWSSGQLDVSATRKGLDEGQAYSDYFDYEERASRIPPHRCLALNRGEREGALKVRVAWDEERAGQQAARILNIHRHTFARFLQDCCQDALSRLIHPSLEREVRRELTDRAEKHAVAVFASNLKALLLQPPIQGRRVIAVDPGFRTGCKVVVLDERGNCLHSDLVFVTGGPEKRASNRQKLQRLAEEHRCDLFAIGNGTACRETEELISELIEESDLELRYVIVNEAGASIYSTSPLARDEFPDLDATVRGTISIGRRLQDPLSELVKIDPQHIGVGMYQHDVTPKLLQQSLDQVIESCVNFVGVDLNTASAALLTHVSGFSPTIARRVVEWRDTHGPFRTRRELLKVAGIGDATFTQAAGFLKITNGDEPLDVTWIHPESYAVASRLLERLSTTPAALVQNSQSNTLRERLAELDTNQLARDLNVGQPTLRDIIEALERPGRDPRTDLPGVVFKQGVLSLEDLSLGMELTGTVLNVVDFGAFIDIGLKDSGLVHVSKMAERFVRNPQEVVSVGDLVTVWVIGIDKQRRRVSLSMVRPADLPTDNPPPAAQQDTRPESAPATPAVKTVRSEVTPKPGSETARASGGTMKGFDELKESWNKRDAPSHD